MHKLATALLTTALVVSGCGGDDSDAKPPKLSKPEAGQCIAKEVADGDDVAPDTQTVVPCSKDHLYEVVAAIAVPDELLAGTTDKEKLARRTELADVNGESEHRKKLQAEVGPQCQEPFRKASGLDRLTVLGKSAKEVSMRQPPGNTSKWYTLTSPELWVDGTAQVVCSFRFSPSTPDSGVIPPATPVRSDSAKPVTTSYLTSKYPASLRLCRNDKAEERVPCTAAHNQEPLFAIDMKAVYGKDFLNGADLKDVNKDQHAMMHAACLDPFQQSGGRLTDSTTLSFRFDAEASTTDSEFWITCLLASQDDSSLGDTFVAFK